MKFSDSNDVEEKDNEREEKKIAPIVKLKEKYRKDLSLYSKIDYSDFSFIHGSNRKCIFPTHSQSQADKNLFLIKSVVLPPTVSPFEIYKSIKP